MKTDSILLTFIMIISMIVVFGLINEKKTKLPGNIALMLFTLIFSAIIVIIRQFDSGNSLGILYDMLNGIDFNAYLMDGVLCFMLFSGTAHFKYKDLRKNLKLISFLALLTTLISSVIFGSLFFGLSCLLGYPLDYLTCLLIGSIVSPTDPIAATGILNKLGLSEDVVKVIEGESLFNDGTGVTVFICLANMIRQTSSRGFAYTMVTNLVGAIIVGLVVSFVLFWLLKKTVDPVIEILISLLAVSISYVLCEFLSFSGVIASVICGIYFATAMDDYQRKQKKIDPSSLYQDFWHLVDEILNYVLYVILGLSFIGIIKVKYMLLLIPCVIIFNLISRFTGVSLSAKISGYLPDSYNVIPFSCLLTWGGLKGGLCLALALSTSEFIDSEPYGIILSCTYTIICFTTIVQGLSTGKVYKFIEKHRELTSSSQTENSEEKKIQASEPEIEEEKSSKASDSPSKTEPETKNEKSSKASNSPNKTKSETENEKSSKASDSPSKTKSETEKITKESDPPSQTHDQTDHENK